MLAYVAQRPRAADDGLDAEDVGMLAVDLALHHTGDIGLELHIVQQHQVTALVGPDFEVALIGALLAPFGVDAEDAGGVGGLEAQVAEGAVVGLVHLDVHLSPLGADGHRAAVAHHVLQQAVAVDIEVVGAEVEGYGEGADGVVAVEAHLHLVGVGRQGGSHKQ